MGAHASYSRIAGLVVVAALGGCAKPVVPIPNTHAAATPVPHEHLDLPIHPGGLQWQAVGGGPLAGGGDMREYVPAGETIADWTQMITALTLPAGQDPRARLAAILNGLRGACASYRVMHSAAHDVPYRSADFLVRCDQPDDAAFPDNNVLLRRHEVIWAKTIQGRSDNYLVWRAWHGDSIPRDSVLASGSVRHEWQDWVDQVGLATGEKNNVLF
jgi:hypothetical protein